MLYTKDDAEKGKKRPEAPFHTRLGLFAIQFPNGFEVSCINHDEAYTEDRRMNCNIDTRELGAEDASYFTETVEVRVAKDGHTGLGEAYVEDGDNIESSTFFANDSVRGHITATELASLIAGIVALPDYYTLKMAGKKLGYRG